ncbi:MAG: hypothetical protein AB8F94_15110 [Saprospiraceae bacterium]
MKTLKIIGLSLVGLIIVLVIGAYFFVKKKLTPDPNYLELTESSNSIPIKWIASEYSPIAVLLLPIKFEGIPKTFYMQFDTGSPSTLLRRQAMISIQEKYPNQISIDTNAVRIETGFHLGEMEVFSKKMKLYDRGNKPINWNDTSKVIVVGTLGGDMIDKKITVMDFKNGCVYFGNEVPDEYQSNLKWEKLIYKKRRTMFPAVVAGRKGKMMHDTGTSGFELITNKKTWKKLSKKNAIPVEAFKVRSWKRELTAYNIESDGVLNFPTDTINLTQVTYIKGASFMQNALMRSLGMGGMIGNQVFMDRVLILDCRNKKYAIIN